MKTSKTVIGMTSLTPVGMTYGPAGHNLRSKGTTKMQRRNGSRQKRERREKNRLKTKKKEGARPNQRTEKGNARAFNHEKKRRKRALEKQTSKN